MRCARCGGCRQWFHFVNRRDSSGWWEYDGWLCLNCGEVIDPVILSNRGLQQRMSNPIPPRPFDGSKIIWVRRSMDAETHGSRAAGRP